MIDKKKLSELMKNSWSYCGCSSGFSGSGGSSASKYKQPDWGAETLRLVEILPETELTILEEVGAAMVMQEVPLIVGNSYVVNFNGTEYTCTASDANYMAALGNLSAADDTLPVTDEPFVLMSIPEEGREEFLGACAVAVPLDGSTTFTLSVKQENVEIHKIPNEYTDFSPLIVNIIVDGTTGRSDVTFEDITKAIAAGKNVYLNNGQILCPLNSVGDSEIEFARFDYNSGSLKMFHFVVSSDGTIDYSNVTITTHSANVTT